MLAITRVHQRPESVEGLLLVETAQHREKLFAASALTACEAQSMNFASICAGVIGTCTDPLG